ncbi:MAG TPA: hypothetical protein EYH06_07420 [Chromatiales bacterium]|nr:hypothetical protein [Thiotrichales bacterium]HIP68405.1 hypothetical protein [Chromatiales bacterium]
MIVTIALIVGIVLILSALVLLLGVAFKTDFIWGLLGLLIVPLFIFMLVYPGKSKFTIALLLIGAVTSGLALWGGADQALDLKTKAEALGIAELPGINRLRARPEVKPVPQEVVEEETLPVSKPEKQKANKTKITKTKKRKNRYREASVGELKHLTGALFKGTTYDGRTIQGRILQANEDEITLSRSVSQGSASFNFRLNEFKEFMVANP